MARRIVLGKRGNDYGLFVSKATEDAASTSTDGLIFDSNAAYTMNVKTYGQGFLSATTTWRSGTPKAEWDSGDAGTVRISHGVGYAPQVYMRWTYPEHMHQYASSGSGTPFASGYGDGNTGKAAMRAYTPGRHQSRLDAQYFTGGGEPQDYYEANSDIGYGCDIEVDATYLYITSYETGGKGLSQVGLSGTQETKFTGLGVYYSYIITTTPFLGFNF